MASPRFSPFPDSSPAIGIRDYEIGSSLTALHNPRKIDDKDLNRPRLKKAPGSGTATDGNDKGSSGDDDLLTLKRRPDSD